MIHERITVPPSSRQPQPQPQPQSLTRRMRLQLLTAWLLLPLVASQDEKALLIKFYDSTGGDNWTTNTKWNSKEPICSWFGIICEGKEDTANSGVVQIILNENNLNGAIPPDLWRLPNLVRLSARKNSISSAGFEGLDTDDPKRSPRSPIDQLILSENHLTEITGIGHAKETLKDFNINKNLIDSALPVELYDLTNLATMYIAFNQIPGTLPALIGKLSRLTELYAFDNALTGSIPSEIGLLARCQILGLGNNAFTGALPTEINQMVNIRDLSIHHVAGDKGGVGLSGPVPTFGEMPFLTLLFLDGNSLSGIIPSDFLRHNNNTNVPISVGLANNNLIGTLPKSLERFESLSIDLVGNRIDEIPHELCELGGWMGGAVEEYKCNAILCATNTYSPQGRTVNDDGICQPCLDGYPYLGATTCSTAPSQREPWRILAGFYLALTGEKWEVKDGWEIIETFDETGLPENSDVKLDICNGWYGVICERGEITEISLPHNDLFGTVPDSIFALPSLQIFDISGNNVQITDFKAASEARNLTALVMSNVKVQTLDGIGGIEKLRLLYLDGLDIEGPLPDELFDLTELRILHLQHGSFSGPLPSGVGQLSNLELLNVYGNKLTGNLPTELGKLSVLHALELSENTFGGALPTELRLLTKLSTFALHQSSGGIGGPLPAFDVFPDLRELNLESNAFAGAIPSNFLGGVADKLAVISVSLGFNQLVGDLPESLVDFQRLVLDLKGNFITGIPSALCDRVDWMEGELGKIPVESRCSAILCPPLTWNEFGKATSDSNSTCLPCDTNPTLFGQVTCGEVKTSREKEILDKIFAATGGRYWTKPHDNWMRPGVPICSREGIFCGGGALSNEGVLDIKLGGFGLRGEIPAELWEFSNLRALILTDNAVGIGFSGIENVQGLRVLKCSACQIRSLTGLRNAPPKLAEVHLARNQFEGFIPDEIYELNQVGALFLNNNHFAGRISSAIGEMTGLSRLELWDNRLTGGVPSELGLLSKLEYFSLSDNELSGAIPSQFEQLGQLVDVRMARQRGRAKLEGPLPTFENNEFLNQVDLSGNGFSGWLPPSFLSKIDPERQVEVDLSSNEFTGPFPEAWGRLESLNIDLSGNMISKLPDALCIKNGWNNGMVGLVNSCDAILCKPGTFGQAGRQTEPTQTCQSCPGGVDAAPFYGSRECLDPRLRAEREILVNFYQGTNGTSWLIQTDWASSRPTCMWFGVTCDDDGFIQELSLPTNWLKSGSSTMAAVSLIFTLSNLKVLDLKDNDVDLDFQQIPATSKLEFVRLSGIGLHSISGVSRASKLRALHVTNNLLTSIPDELYDMPTLESLFISFNSITGSLSTRLGQLKNIKELYMFGNHLTGTIPTVVGLLTELTDFVVASNFLSGELPDEFSSLPKLEQLSVYDQEGLELITGPVPSFSQAPNLWYFDASNNDLTGPIPDNFMVNSAFTDDAISIYLQNNAITGTIPLELAKFDKLDLNLAGNDIEEIPNDLCHIAGWMQGNVGTVGNCSAILCPAETFNQFGRRSPGSPCLECSHLEDVIFLGQTRCENFTSERETLNSLYFATGGEFWNNNTRWQTEAPICSWDGVLCEDGDLQDTEGITTIRLEENGLSGTLPSEVWTLPSLRYLSVKGNPGLQVNFEGLANVADTLETLYLSGVRMSSLDGVSQATSLRKLHLTGNDLKGTFPQELYRLSDTLEYLYIAYNLFFGPLPTRLGEMTKLKEFFAFGNDFISTIPTEVGLMRDLRILVLSENLLFGQIPNELSSMPNLEIFSAFRREKSGPRLSGSLPSLEKLPQLTDLYLQGNEIQGTIPANFLSSSRSAQVVILSSNLLTGEVPSDIASLPSLTLQLEGNQLTNFPLAICENKDWMDGAVGLFGCDAFLCPPGSASPVGRTANASAVCANCTQASQAPYFGSTTCEAPPSNRDILMNLYYATSGDNWIRNDFWGATVNVCDWYGIACTNGEVVEINLRGNHLVGLPGTDLFRLKELKILWLYSNPITFSFENIGSARKLQDLRLDATHLHSLHGIGAASSLVSLDVRFTAAKGPFPSEILQLTNLRTLSMSGNGFAGTLPSSFSSLRFLVSLRLDSNYLTGRLPVFDDMNFLRNLDLSRNSLTGSMSRKFLDKVASSESVFINLAQNQITGVVPEELDRFKDVTLYLRDNRILGLPLTLCDNEDWNKGGVGDFGCDGIMCKPGTANEFGRRRSESSCISCPDARYYGETSCNSPASTQKVRRPLLAAALGLLGFWVSFY